MSDETLPVWWTGRQAVVTLPEHIDSSNADQVREQLLWLINRGATVLIADLTGTVSCEYSGADALARAYQRGAANGTQLRLVVIADVVRRVLSLSGLDRLVAVYPALDAAVAAGAGPREAPGELGTTVNTDRGTRDEELLDSVVNSIFGVAMILQAAQELPRDVTVLRITEALRRLDDVVRDVRQHILAGDGTRIQPGNARMPPPYLLERSALAQNRAALLQERLARTAHALQFAAADTAALLARRADLAAQPGRVDYPTEIKRWQAVADLAGQLAERWERRP
jgi:anti-sigma B factor antagonist